MLCLRELPETFPNTVTMSHVYPFTTTPVMPLNAILLLPCFAVLLNVDMVISLEGMDGLIGKLDTIGVLATITKRYNCSRRT